MNAAPVATELAQGHSPFLSQPRPCPAVPAGAASPVPLHCPRPLSPPSCPQEEILHRAGASPLTQVLAAQLNKHSCTLIAYLYNKH